MPVAFAASGAITDPVNVARQAGVADIAVYEVRLGRLPR